MKRPFAQINFLTDDIETAKTGGLTIDENTQSSVTISNAATTLDPFTNTVGGITEAEVIFGDAKMPIAEKLTNWCRNQRKGLQLSRYGLFLGARRGCYRGCGKV